MICINCGDRYAPFPEKDFNFIKVEGWKPTRRGAVSRRMEIYRSDEMGYCCHDEYPISLDLAREAWFRLDYLSRAGS